eukprot:jgi/Tetstr1/434381/TSEL_023482.t1
MMAELRRVWYLLDSQDIRLRARYIRSAANVWADPLSRHMDSDDWQLDLVLFAELFAVRVPHDRPARVCPQRPDMARYNAGWFDPTCEAVDELHMGDAA